MTATSKRLCALGFSVLTLQLVMRPNHPKERS